MEFSYDTVSKSYQYGSMFPENYGDYTRESKETFNHYTEMRQCQHEWLKQPPFIITRF